MGLETTRNDVYMLGFDFSLHPCAVLVKFNEAGDFFVVKIWD